MRQKMRGIGTGTISLVLIFSVLCLTIFAMLTLSTANAEKALVTRAASFVEGYYKADTQATRMTAHIVDSHRNETLLDSLADIQATFNVEIEYEQTRGGVIYIAFSNRVSDFHNLSVRLRLAEGEFSILKWRVFYSQPWEFDDTLPVWDGIFY